VSVAAALRTGAPAPLRARSEPALLLASLAWSAATVHAAAAVVHLDEWLLAAVFFAVVAVAQFAIGAWLWARPEPRALLLAGASGAALAGLWAVSRTVGLPFGPEHGHAESVGVLDLVATGDEVLVLATVVALGRGTAHVVLHPVLIRAALIAGMTAALLAGGHAH
jgi:hypothetical protein